MAITQEFCNSFKRQLFTATHDFTASTGDQFKAALYVAAATLNKNTTAYTGTNEVANGNGYTTGGKVITSVTPVLSGDFAICDFDNVTWSTSTITSRGTLLYNDSVAGDPAVIVLDFGSDQSSSNGDFTLQFPTPDSSNAIIRLT